MSRTLPGVAATSPPGPWRSELLPLALVILAVVVLYFTSPRQGEFFWSEAPRNALNGAFVMDLIAQRPWQDPVGWAYAYYAQYPALTILFYPPLFHVLSAPFHAVFGVSHHAALLAVMAHYVAFGWGVYRLGRLWLPVVPALAVAWTMMFLPEIAFWGRQVLLELPAYAFLVWSAVCFVHHLRQGRTGMLVAAVVLLLAAMYTKLSVVFVAAAYVLALLHRHGWALFRQRRGWLLLLGSGLAVLPLVLLTLKFGQANVQSVSELPDSAASRATLAGWLWYARMWPSQFGPPLLAVLALGALAGAWLGRGRSGMTGPERSFWWAWFGVGYLFFSYIELKEARHSVFILLPMVLGVAVLLQQARPAWLASAFAGTAAACAVGWTLLERPVYYVDGYARMAQIVAERAPPGSRVLFSGYRDGAFTFNMRTHENRRDLAVIRADKMLLRVSVRRELGVEQKALSDAEMLQDIHANAIHYLVVQPGFWTDLDVMRRFEALLAQHPFEEVLRVPTPANYPAHEKELVLYRNLAAAAVPTAARRIELPVIGRAIDLGNAAAASAPAAAPAASAPAAPR